MLFIEYLNIYPCYMLEIMVPILAAALVDILPSQEVFVTSKETSKCS
jgi:hypothetical protein